MSVYHTGSIENISGYKHSYSLTWQDLLNLITTVYSSTKKNKIVTVEENQQNREKETRAYLDILNIALI